MFLEIWNRLCQDVLKGCLESERHVGMPAGAMINIYERHLSVITCYVVWHLADQRHALASDSHGAALRE